MKSLLFLTILLCCCSSLPCDNTSSKDEQSNLTIFAYHVLPTEFRSQATSLGHVRGKARLKEEEDHATERPQPIIHNPHTKDAHLDESEHQEKFSSHEQSSNAGEEERHESQQFSSDFVSKTSNNTTTSESMIASSAHEVYEFAPETSNEMLNNVSNNSNHLQHLLVNSSQHSHYLLNASHSNEHATEEASSNRTRNQLLVISFDAFRYDYNRMFRRQMPNFERISREGVWAPMGIQTAFVTKTFTTHFSIATGKSQ